MHLEIITLPPRWNARKDCRHFAERWDPDPSYTEALWERARFHHRNFLHAIERALRCAGACDATLTHIEPCCLTPAEKIDIVLGSVRSRPRVFVDPGRMLKYLLAGQFVEKERARVLREYRLAGDQAWMYPVVELIDYFGDVAAELRDTVKCEKEFG